MEASSISAHIPGSSRGSSISTSTRPSPDCTFSRFGGSKEADVDVLSRAPSTPKQGM